MKRGAIWSPTRPASEFKRTHTSSSPGARHRLEMLPTKRPIYNCYETSRMSIGSRSNFGKLAAAKQAAEGASDQTGRFLPHRNLCGAETLAIRSAVAKWQPERSGGRSSPALRIIEIRASPSVGARNDRCSRTRAQHGLRHGMGNPVAADPRLHFVRGRAGYRLSWRDEQAPARRPASFDRDRSRPRGSVVIVLLRGRGAGPLDLP